VTDIASYGTQLGTLSKVVLALAEEKERKHIDPHIAELKKRVEKIDALKKDYAADLEEDIKYRLKELKKSNRDTFERLIIDHHKELCDLEFFFRLDSFLASTNLAGHPQGVPLQKIFPPSAVPM